MNYDLTGSASPRIEREAYLRTRDIRGGIRLSLYWDDQDAANAGWYVDRADNTGSLGGDPIDDIDEDDSVAARLAAAPDVDPDDWTRTDRPDVTEWTVTVYSDAEKARIADGLPADCRSVILPKDTSWLVGNYGECDFFPHDDEDAQDAFVEWCDGWLRDWLKAYAADRWDVRVRWINDQDLDEERAIGRIDEKDVKWPDTIGLTERVDWRAFWAAERAEFGASSDVEKARIADGVPADCTSVIVPADLGFLYMLGNYVESDFWPMDNEEAQERYKAFADAWLRDWLEAYATARWDVDIWWAEDWEVDEDRSAHRIDRKTVAWPESVDLLETIDWQAFAAAERAEFGTAVPIEAL